MAQSSSHPLETCEGGWHINSTDGHNITGGTFPSIDPSSNNLDLSGNMTNWDLFRGLLNFELLVAYESTGFNLHYQLTLGLVLNTLSRRAFYFRVEFSCVDDLIDLKSANITCIDSHLDTGFHITCSGNYSPHSDKASYLIRLDIPHFGYLFLGIWSMNYKDLILSLQFRW